MTDKTDYEKHPLFRMLAVMSYGAIASVYYLIYPVVWIFFTVCSHINIIGSFILKVIKYEVSALAMATLWMTRVFDWPIKKLYEFSTKPNLYNRSAKWALIYCIVLPLDIIQRLINEFICQFERVAGVAVRLVHVFSDAIIGCVRKFDLSGTTLNDSLKIYKSRFIENNLEKFLSFERKKDQRMKDRLSVKFPLYMGIINGTKSTYEATKPRVEDYSWWSLLITQTVKTCHLLAVLVFKFIFEFIDDVFNVFREKVLLLKEYSKKGEEELSDMLEIFFAKICADTKWVSQAVKWIMFLPNICIAWLEQGILLLKALFQLTMEVVKMPLMFIQNVFLLIGQLGDQYYPDELLLKARNYQPKRSTDIVYEYEKQRMQLYTDTLGEERLPLMSGSP